MNGRVYDPLSYTDPSGFFFKKLFKGIGKLFKGVARAVKSVLRTITRNIRTIAAIGVLFIPGVNAYASGFVSGLVASGGDLKAGLINALTAGAFEWVGGVEWATHFGDVAFAAKAVAHGVVGGVSSLAGGGKFKNGAMTAAYAYAFNELRHRFVNPTGKRVRGCDEQGCGEYLADREGRTGKHLGADYISDPGQEVVAIADGTVARLPSGDYDDIVVGDGKGVSYKLLYLNVDKSLEIGSTVTAGQVLGTAQDITGRYPGITNHVHVKLRVDSNVVNPEDYIEPP